MNKLLFALGGTILLGGCVGTLETRPYRERTDSLGAALKGVPYSLPKLQYEIKLTRYLAECPGELIDGKPTALRFAIEAVETPTYGPGEAYTVDYRKLPGFLRTGTFEIKYWPNGNLKSVGAGAEDKTADLIRDTVKTGLSVASMMAGGALSGGPARGLAANPETVTGCTPEALALVQEAREIRKGLKSRPKTIEKLSKDVERFQARAALRLRDPRDRDELISLFKAIDAEQEWVTTKTERLAEITDKLGVAQTIVWDSKPGTLDEQVWTYELSAEQRTKLAALLAPVSAPVATGAEELERRKFAGQCFGEAGAAGFAQKAANCVAQHLNLSAGVRLASHLPACTAPGATRPECVETATRVVSGPGGAKIANRQYRDARDTTPDSGIFVREMAKGRLLLCRTAVLADANGKLSGCTAPHDEGKLKEANFPQYGQLRYLPLRVGTFQAREMALSVAEDGRMESFSYKSTKAAGAALAAAAADAASQADAALERIETERRDDRKYAFDHANDDIAARVATLTKEAEERKLLAPPAPANALQPQLDQLAALQAEVAILKLQRQKNDLLKMAAGAGGSD